MASSPKQRIPSRDDYGSGVYRRSIRLRSSGHEIVGELADDFHHFGVRLLHDGEKVTQIEGQGLRVPWTTCPGAVLPLQRMLGAPLSRSPFDLLGFTAAREQCTHLHDLACLAAAHAARLAQGLSAERRYDVALPDRIDGATRAELARDGETLIVWPLEKSKIGASDPTVFAGLDLAGRELRRAIASHADPDLAEAAWVLQRAVFIGTGRRHDFERMPEAGAFASVVGPACHSFSPDRVADALRVRGTVRDFSGGLEGIFDRE